MAYPQYSHPLGALPLNAAFPYYNGAFAGAYAGYPAGYPYAYNYGMINLPQTPIALSYHIPSPFKTLS